MVAGKVAALALGICGCATEQYWVPAYPAATSTPLVVYMAEVPCGVRALGCYYPSLNVTYLKSSLSGALLDCVRKHEDMHAQGYSHHDRGTFFYICNAVETLEAIR